MDQLNYTVRLHIERYCDLVIHPVPCIDQRTLVLCIKMLALLGELLGMSVDQVYKAYDIFPAAVNDDVRESSLALITVFDPAAVVDGQLIDQGYRFLLGSNRSDPADLGLIIERHVYKLGSCYKERLQNIVFLRFLFKKTDVLYIVYLTYAAACINYIVTDLKAHTNLPFLEYLKNLYAIYEKTICKNRIMVYTTRFILARYVKQVGSQILQKTLYFGMFV